MGIQDEIGRGVVTETKLSWGEKLAALLIVLIVAGFLAANLGCAHSRPPEISKPPKDAKPANAEKAENAQFVELFEKIDQPMVVSTSDGQTMIIEMGFVRKSDMKAPYAERYEKDVDAPLPKGTPVWANFGDFQCTPRNFFPIVEERCFQNAYVKATVAGSEKEEHGWQHIYEVEALDNPEPVVKIPGFHVDDVVVYRHAIQHSFSEDIYTVVNLPDEHAEYSQLLVVNSRLN